MSNSVKYTSAKKIHTYSDFINYMDHIYILGTETSSVTRNQTKEFKNWKV